MKTFSRFQFYVIICLLLVFSGADSYSQLPGYDILKTEISARAAGMGGAFTGISGDHHSVFYNPAGLSGLSSKKIGFTYLDHTLDIKSGNFIYASEFKQDIRYALGMNYINYGSFEGRDLSGLPTGTYSAQDVVFTGGVAKKHNTNLSYGGSVKMLYSKIAEYSSSVMAINAGMTYFIPKHELTLGLSFENVGYVMSAYYDTKDDMPTMIKGGFSKKLAHLPLLVNIEYRQMTNSDYQFVGGGEFTFSDRFKGRFGYNSYGRDQKIDDEGGILTGLSLGFGVYFKQYIVDYSFTSKGVIGDLQRLTVSWSM
ncbi:PorV/PorQ family protein [candidate division KSB1 bacterium]